MLEQSLTGLCGSRADPGEGAVPAHGQHDRPHGRRGVRGSLHQHLLRRHACANLTHPHLAQPLCSSPRCAIFVAHCGAKQCARPPAARSELLSGLQVLRENRDALMNVLETFAHDPLVEW
eukprot:560071-Rhodomonas_salina.2